MCMASVLSEWSRMDARVTSDTVPPLVRVPRDATSPELYPRLFASHARSVISFQEFLFYMLQYFIGGDSDGTAAHMHTQHLTAQGGQVAE